MRTAAVPRPAGAVVVAAVVTVALALGLVACSRPAPSASAASSPSTASSAPPEQPAAATEYRTGRAATVSRPAQAPRAVVVLVPGGSWRVADPTGLLPLADRLVADGFAAVTITYGSASSDDHHPVPAQDVACAVAFAAGEVPGVPVVLVGHSAGAHLAALVGLVPDQGAECPHDGRAADAVVGLAGPYDVGRADIAANLFGAPRAEQPARWRDGNPHTWADRRPDLPFLLVHGQDDDVVPAAFTADLAAALEASGHPVEVEPLAGVDHLEIIRPEVVGDLLVGWLARRTG